MDEAAIGVPMYINEAFEGYLPVEKEYARDRNFIVRVKEDSMIGAGIEPGDLVIVKPGEQIEIIGKIADIKRRRLKNNQPSPGIKCRLINIPLVV